MSDDVYRRSWITEPTTGLRFILRDGKHILQQEFLKRDFVDGPAFDREWRDVPLAREEDE